MEIEAGIIKAGRKLFEAERVIKRRTLASPFHSRFVNHTKPEYEDQLHYVRDCGGTKTSLGCLFRIRTQA